MQGDHKHDFSRIPDEPLAKLAVETAMMDCDMRVQTPEGMEDFDEWDALRDATVETAEWADGVGVLVVHLKTETHYSVQTQRATRLEPPEHKNVTCDVFISIWWSLNPDDRPDVYIEVVDQ